MRFGILSVWAMAFLICVPSPVSNAEDKTTQSNVCDTAFTIVDLKKIGQRIVIQRQEVGSILRSAQPLIVEKNSSGRLTAVSLKNGDGLAIAKLILLPLKSMNESEVSFYVKDGYPETLIIQLLKELKRTGEGYRFQIDSDDYKNIEIYKELAPITQYMKAAQFRFTHFDIHEEFDGEERFEKIYFHFEPYSVRNLR